MPTRCSLEFQCNGEYLIVFNYIGVCVWGGYFYNILSDKFDIIITDFINELETK